ncbi:MAG: hypothetical protein KIS74_06485 [Burkholderiales bacterium]|nr:hypothetical protein [Burkholderiales bacterium]
MALGHAVVADRHEVERNERGDHPGAAEDPPGARVPPAPREGERRRDRERGEDAVRCADPLRSESGIDVRRREEGEARGEVLEREEERRAPEAVLRDEGGELEERRVAPMQDHCGRGCRGQEPQSRRAPQREPHARRGERRARRIAATPFQQRGEKGKRDRRLARQERGGEGG